MRTLSSGKLARFLTRAPLVLSRHLWIWPLLGAILITIVGLWTRTLVEGSVKAELISRLQTLLSANVAALKLWFSEQEADAKSLAGDVRIQEAVMQLTALSMDPTATRETLLSSPASKTLQVYLRPVLDAQHYLDFVVIGSDRRILASGLESEVNRSAPPGYDPFLRRALAGQATVSRPFMREVGPGLEPQRPSMFAASPVLSAYGDVIAVLALRMDPEREFSSIFAVARIGETGEAYAFDNRGVMLTGSRFNDELKSVGLITNTPDATPILHVQLLDPGHELRPNELTPGRPRHLPLTRMAASATTEWDGYDVEGYRNYKGIKVIGAWAWLPEYGMGLATEVTTEEAFQTLFVLRRVFFSLFLLLAFSGAAIFVFSLLVERLEASVRKGAMAQRRLGQYVLLEEIGRGSSGIVYRARHSLLRRPVAIKVLSPDMTNESSAARFEHEVQMTSQLTHPNTVSIFDYGRTPEGLFYYAMEYLSGIDLDQLVREFGPQSEARTIHIMRQVCGSIAEAHRIGLIHRDVKPANILLTRRGGVSDTVKVLDFGLVKAVNFGPKGLAANAVVGTPHFMAPEAISHPEAVDARSDIYSIGAVGYWLVTGRTLFQTGVVDEIFDQQVKSQPAAPHEVIGGEATDLQQVLMRCLSKEPSQRPATAREVGESLARCAAAKSWGAGEADKWWRANLGGFDAPPPAMLPDKTLVITPGARP